VFVTDPPSLLREFSQVHPGVAVSAREGIPMPLQVWSRQPLLVMMPRDHELAHRRTVDLADIAAGLGLALVPPVARTLPGGDVKWATLKPLGLEFDCAVAWPDDGNLGAVATQSLHSTRKHFRVAMT
jgi:hypothetical protein